MKTLTHLHNNSAVQDTTITASCTATIASAQLGCGVLGLYYSSGQRQCEKDSFANGTYPTLWVNGVVQTVSQPFTLFLYLECAGKSPEIRDMKL